MEAKGVPVVPCGCSLRTGTVRRGIRETIADWEREHPHLRENILSAMGNINHGRLLDTRYLDPDGEMDEAEGENASSPTVADFSGSMSEARDTRVIEESRQQIERLSKLGWYHSIELPDGRRNRGPSIDRTTAPAAAAVPHSRRSRGQARARYRRLGRMVQLRDGAARRGGAGARFGEKYAAARSAAPARFANRISNRRHLPAHVRTNWARSISCCSLASCIT